MISKSLEIEKKLEKKYQDEYIQNYNKIECSSYQNNIETFFMFNLFYHRLL